MLKQRCNGNHKGKCELHKTVVEHTGERTVEADLTYKIPQSHKKYIPGCPGPLLLGTSKGPPFATATLPLRNM